MLRMDEFNKIRKEFFINGKSIYQISRDYHRSWETISNIVKLPEHKISSRGKRPNKANTIISSSIIDEITEFLDLEIKTKIPKKQRFTAKYIFTQLVKNNNFQGSSKRIRTVVAQLRKSRNQTKKTSYLHLDFEIGESLQVDHGPTTVEINNTIIDGYLFVSTIPLTSIRYCQFYPTKATEAWGEFHERGFIFYGGTFSTVTYDNDSVLKHAKSKKETNFILELQMHYKFKAIFCNKAAGWEKGAVECSVGFCRRNFLPGIKSFKSFSELNNYLEDCCLEHITTETNYKSGKTLIELFDEVASKVQPFNKGKVWGRWESLKVNNFQCISYQTRSYSAPEKYLGSIMQVFITAHKIEIYSDSNLVYSHDRLFLLNRESLILDHYLNQLLKKPRAYKDAKVMKDTSFSKALKILKQRIDSKHAEQDAGKHFIKILLLSRVSTKKEFKTAIELSLEYQLITYDGVKSILSQVQVSEENIISTKFEKIDHHYSLDKYMELEQKGDNFYD